MAPSSPATWSTALRASASSVACWGAAAEHVAVHVAEDAADVWTWLDGMVRDPGFTGIVAHNFRAEIENRQRFRCCVQHEACAHGRDDGMIILLMR
jgi:hypothetical protein